MRSLSNLFLILLVLLSAAFQQGCGGEDETDTSELGTLEVSGEWAGELPENARLVLIVMECPFIMPPQYDSIGEIVDGVASGSIEGVEPGEWCLQTYIDVDPEDGLMPKYGYDITLVPEEEGDQSVAFEIEAGKITTVEVQFELVEDSDGDVDGESENSEVESESEEIQVPEDEVWLKVDIDCSDCTGDAPVIVYGYEGEELGTIPQIFNSFEEDISFPMSVIIKETGPLTSGPVPEGKHIIGAYQDLNDADGMGPQDGDPIDDPQIIELEKGKLNELEFTLE